MVKTVLAVAASSVAMFLLAGLYTGVLARSFMLAHLDANLLRTPPNLSLVFAGYVVLAALMSVLYRRLVRTRTSPAWSGLRFGLVAGIFWLMPYSLVLFGVYGFPYVALPLNFAWALVEQGVGGLVIGLIQGKPAADA